MKKVVVRRRILFLVAPSSLVASIIEAQETPLFITPQDCSQKPGFFFATPGSDDIVSGSTRGFCCSTEVYNNRAYSDFLYREQCSGVRSAEAQQIAVVSDDAMFTTFGANLE